MKSKIIIFLFLSLFFISCTTQGSGPLTIQAISKDLVITNSYLITTSKGTKIALDPYRIADYENKVDIILITHGHPDHNDRAFMRHNPDAETMISTVGELNYKDVKIKGIASAHTGDEFHEQYPSNVIYIVEADGFKIAHMGDIGQSRLTEEQLKQIGEIDLIFMQYTNQFSGISVEDGQGVFMTKQLDPQIVVPTHCDKEEFPIVAEQLGMTKKHYASKIVLDHDLGIEKSFQPMKLIIE